jgi:uncharacterized membrane protein HdeD (DUF308 family)
MIPGFAERFTESHWDEKSVADKVGHATYWMEGLGVLLMILGMISLIFEGAASVASVYLIGVLLLGSGIAHGANAFGYWRVRWGGFFAGVILGGLYGIAGILCFIRPVASLVGLTYILGLLFFSMGIFRILFHLSTRFPAWGWGVVNGIVNLGLGFLIIAGWPENSLMVLGILVGIDLMFAGMNAISIGSTVRRMIDHLAPASGHRPITRFQH